MGVAMAVVLLALTSSVTEAAVVVPGTPYLAKGPVPISFCEEFPEFVNPSSTSKFLDRIEDMVFIHENITGAAQSETYLWPGGRIPYEFASPFDAFERRIILKAMALWEEQTCIRFHPRLSSDKNSIYISSENHTGCSSFIGRIPLPKKQGVSLGPGCVTISTALHQLGHAIGLYNKYDDRDINIAANTNRVFFHSQLQNQSISIENCYDIASVMLYRILTDSVVTSEATQHDVEELSPLDIATVNHLYNCGDCSSHPPPSTVIPPLSFPAAFICGRLIETSQPGSFIFPSFPPNTACNLAIAVPEGYGISYQVHLRRGSDDLDNLTKCENSYIAFYDGATTKSHRIQNYSPSPRICTRERLSYVYRLPINVATISYQAGPSQPQPLRVSYDLFDINECSGNTQCESCTNFLGTYKCTCRPGFYQSYSARTCYDINECACGNGGCEHNCTNTAGSYTCSCRSGYHLQADGKSCSKWKSITSPWRVVRGYVNETSCPVSFSVPNPPPVNLGSCGQQVVTVSTRDNFDTILNTPGWPDDPYPLNVDCEWSIQCPNSNDYLDIKFEEEFRIAGKMPDCPKDYVSVYSGGSKVGGPFCHLTAPKTIESLDASNITLRFYSGEVRGVTRTGFAVGFRCRLRPPPPTTPEPTTPTILPTTEMAGSCGGVITAALNHVKLSFSTPGWPDQPYPLNVSCVWMLHCPSSSRFINIEFEESFRVAGKMPLCPKDRVIIQSKETTYGPFCHLSRPDPISFLDVHLTNVTFQTGPTRGITRTGFGARFWCS